MTMLNQKTFTAFVVALALASGPLTSTAASAQSVTLGDEGEIYRLLVGSKSELFPEMGGEDTPLLALDITRQDGTQERFIVPETDVANDTEKTAALFYEEVSKTVFLAWDGRVNNIHSVLSLASYNADGWSDVIQIRGGWLTPRTAPRIAVTREHFSAAPGVETQALQRTYIHLVWWEGPDSGDEIYYTPIILENGTYVGEHPVTLLGDLIDGETASTGVSISAALSRAPALSLGVDGEALVIGFSNVETGTLHLIEIRPAAGAIANVAGGIGHRIIDIGYAFSWRDNPLAFATAIRQEFHQLGTNLHPVIRSFLARELFEFLSEPQPEDVSLEDFARRAQELLVEATNTILSGRLSNISGGIGHRIIDIGFSSVTEIPEESTEYFFTSRAIRSLAAPETPEAPTQLYLSGSGSEALVAWDEEGVVRYVETQAGGWSTEATLSLRPDLDRAMVHSLLRQRITNR